MGTGRVHQMTQHRSALQGVEARTLVSDRVFPRHSHDQYGIGVMLSGAHRSWSTIGQVEAQAGDTIMVNPGEMHDGMPVGNGMRAWRMLYFDPTVVARIATGEGQSATEVMRPAAHDPILAARFAQLFSRVTMTSPDPIGIEEGLMVLVMHVLRRHAFRPPSSNGPSPPIKKALARLHADPAAPVTLRELSELAGVSRFQLIRGFNRELGVTPHAYLLQRRVLLARALMTGGQSIVEAAMNAGFADQSHLTRAFFRQFGVTPKRYVAALA